MRYYIHRQVKIRLTVTTRRVRAAAARPRSVHFKDYSQNLLPEQGMARLRGLNSPTYLAKLNSPVPFDTASLANFVHVY